MALTPAGYRLIQSWEGCRLQAYPDPASGGAPWTIGYGHTGPEVKPGLVISQQQAEAWFRSDVARFESAVDRCLLPQCQLRPQQRDALVSFCFNVGAGAFSASTLVRRLKAGEGAATVLAQELPRWVHGPHGPLPGLVNRRQAELLHARQA
jgi:GH24 family phage-related lysozyme (muramidase)